MGVSPREKAELASYKLKDVAQVWFEQWRDERPIGADPIDWGVFKTALLDRFFPLELREQKLVEFSNLRQGNMSVKEYSLKFTQLYKYAPTLVENSRARMIKFVMEVFGLVEEECRTTMLHHDMDISRLLVYAQQLEETKLRRKIRDMKRSRPDEQNQSRSKRIRKPQRGNGGGFTFERPRCATCGKQHLGKCLAGKDGCFGCWSKGHKIRDCPTLKAKGKETNQVSHDGPDPNAPTRNHFYMLQANKDKGTNEGKQTSMKSWKKISYRVAITHGYLRLPYDSLEDQDSPIYAEGNVKDLVFPNVKVTVYPEE
ncbi:uncharacterized protein LOC125847230 [Solanum stenotomum]|uniref:uncharacterized protein LOC125847230 n=1 Tax=Solanum stenotomum TaxID=172797 RepID=UPI0020D1BA20|nr:uncharacterized protein LOC125847230 [Solanum stenotomum]